MTTYQLVPYLISVNVKGSPNETRPLDDLFGGQEDFSTEIAGLLAAHVGHVYKEPGSGGKGSAKSLRIESVGKGAPRQLNAEISHGRSGIESKIRRPDGSELARGFMDTELMPLRHFLIYPANGHRAVLFAERVGGNGAISALLQLLKTTWASKHSTTTLTIANAMSEAAMQGALAQRPISRIRLVKAKAPNGSMALGGLEVEYVMEIKPKGRGKNWLASKFSGGDGTADSILREVVPVLRPGASQEDGAKALAEDGWQVAVTLRLAGGTSRTVMVEDKTSISMSFPIIEGEAAPKERPGDAVVLEACRGVIRDGLASPWGLEPSAASVCTWSEVPWQDQGGWKAQWDVDDQPASPGAGAVPQQG